MTQPELQTVSLRVRPIAWTHFHPPSDVPWETDAEGGQALAEFAGRACYQSWDKPNPATATNAGYLRHILDVGHLSVLEHGTVTMYITGASRSFTHELVRHRHFSYSQLSQRYVPERDAAMVEPDVIAADPYLHGLFMEATTVARDKYAELLHGLERKLDAEIARHHRAGAPPFMAAAEVQATLGGPAGGLDTCAACHESWPCRTSQTSRTARLKAARQAARSVLPNATETRIVVTGNYRAWRHFINMRASEHADVEIRHGAVTCLVALHTIAPNVFGDFALTDLPDGTVAATSHYRSDSDS